jgi:hypothetical protein
MKQFRFNKGKVAVLLSTSILLGMSSPQTETLVLGLTAPTIYLTDFTFRATAKQFALSKEEKDFLKFAQKTPQTLNTLNP